MTTRPYPTRGELRLLSDPFPAEDVEWRLQTCGQSNDRFWGIALAYITSRAIMERLDDICGPDNWQNVFKEGPGGGVVCGISIRVGDDEWVTKWDGAENTDVEAVKGGLSGALKRAGAQWGIGRYLYNLKEGFVEIADENDRDAFKGVTKDKKKFRWYPPDLPQWALPGGGGSPRGQKVHDAIIEYVKDSFRAAADDALCLVGDGKGTSLKEYISAKGGRARTSYREAWALLEVVQESTKIPFVMPE